MAIPELPPSISGQIRVESLGLACEQVIVTLNQIKEAVNTAIETKRKVELALAKTQDATQNPWSSFAESLKESINKGIDEIQEQIDAFISADFNTIGDLTSTVDSTISSIIDPTSVWSSASDAFTDGLGSPQGLVGPDPAVSRARLVKSTNDRSKGVCAPGVTFQALLNNTFAAAGNVTNQVKQIGKDVQEMVGAFRAAAGSGKGFGDGLKKIAGDALLFVLRNELITLKQIIETVEKINKTVLELRDDDYRINHRHLISLARQRVWEADDAMKLIIDTIVAGGEIDEASYQYAEDNVEQAKEILGGDYTDDLLKVFPSKRMLKLVAYYIELDVLIRTFEQSSKKNRQQSKNFFDFDSNFSQKTPGIDGMYAPVLALIRCRLQRTAQDMSDTMTKDQIITFILKEKQWYAELILTLGIFKGLEYFNKMKEAIGSFDLMKVLNFQVELDNGQIQTSYSGFVSPETLVEDMRRYQSFVKKKINQNLPATVVTSTGDIVLFNIAEYIEDRSALQGALFLSVFAPDNMPPSMQRIAGSLLANPIQQAVAKLDANAIQGIVLAQAFFEYLDSSDADLAANALKEGNFVELFAMDIINSLKKQLEDYAAIVLNCLNGQPDPDAKLLERAQLDYESAQDQVRASTTWKDIYYNSNQRHFQSVVIGEFDDSEP